MVPTPATHGITKQLRPRRRMRTASPPVTVTECRPRGRRRWTASTAVCLMGVVVARFHGISLVDAAATARTDGITYCWQVGGSVYASSFNSSVSIQEGSQDDCALSLAMQFSKDTFYVGEAIQASWTATLRRDTNGSFLTNKFGIQELFSAQDRVSQKPYQIVFSRIESCTADAQDCDPVVGNTNLISTVTNKPANFTDSGFATFSTDRVAFTASGKVRLLVHLVLPGQNPESTRYDFALYKTLAITDRPTLSPIRNTSGSSQSEKDGGSSSSSGGGLSTQAIGIMFVVGMVAVALVAVGFVMIRKNKAEILPPDPPTVQKGPDGRTRADASSTDMDDEFAMLSNEERFMMSQGPKKSGGFLSASAEGPRSMLEESRAAAKAKAKAPLPYVGSSSSGGHHHPGDSDLASDDHIVDPSNPASMRHHGMYVEMPPTAQPMNGPPRTSKIYYNDIREDEIASMRGNSTKMASTMNPFKNTREAPLQRTLVAGASPSASTFGGEPGEPSSEWRVSTELTFDDLRPSADLGPALTLDDLLENKQRKKRGVSDSISEASSKF